MKHFSAVLFSLVFSALICESSYATDLKNGIWRAVLTTQSGAEIPFNFSVTDSLGKKLVHLINGAERFKVEDVSIVKDSVIIKLPLFDSDIRASFKGNKLTGNWTKYLPDRRISMPFAAEHGIEKRFLQDDQNPSESISGRWATRFVSENGKDTTFAIGEFQQQDAKVTGTFLTTTGDYRFLEGTLSKNKLYLSTFDGSHAYLFTATLANNSLIDGRFYSGLSGIKNWTADKDEKAKLPDAYSLTKLKAGQRSLSFNFKDLDGKPVSSNDNRFKNKVVIVQFLGSWCPNCMDETAYLSPFYKKFKDKGVEVVGLAYELTNDIERSKKSVLQLQKRFDITYPLLLTGYTNKEVLKSIPSLNEFKAFPTTVIINKQGAVVKIHTGFSGPGTGEHYISFIEEFEREVVAMLAEN